MGRNRKFYVVNITFILIFIFGVAILFNSKALAQEIPQTPGTIDTATSSPIPVDLSSTETQIPGDPATFPANESGLFGTSTQTREEDLSSTHVNVVSGWFNIIRGDSRNSSISKPVSRYILTNDAGESITLILSENVAGLGSGIQSFNHMYVTVEGIWSDAADNQINPTLQVTGISMDDVQTDSISAESLTGSRPFISILCKFNNISDEPKSQAYFQDMYSSSYPGLSNYWNEVSYGQFNLAGSAAAGWFTLPQPRSYYVYDTNNDGYLDLDFIRAADDCTTAADPTVDFSAFPGGINLMFNYDLDGYSWSGRYRINLDGVDYERWTTWYEPWGYSNITYLAQVMGYFFGLPYSTGHGIEYNNVWDLMGDNWDSCDITTDPTYGCLSQHPNANNKAQQGWIPLEQLYVLPDNSEATINIEQLALPASNNYLIAYIPILDSQVNFYTVEVRNKTGYDTKLPAKAVIIHKIQNTISTPSDVIDLDSTIYTGDAGAQWLVGEKFVDSENRISIEVLSESATGFQVKLKRGFTPVGYGTYDERSADVVYTGTWVAQTISGNYMNTEKYSKVVGSTSSISFSGEEISVIYRGYPSAFGTMGVTIDGEDFGTINQNTSTQTLQKQWHSGNLGTGIHNIVLTHLTGTYVSLDGFVVSGPPTATPTVTNTNTPTMTRTPTVTMTPRPPVGYGTYDERSIDVVYTGSWVAQALIGNYLNTEKYSKVLGSTASFTFAGEAVGVIYRGYPSAFGNMGVAIDGVSVGTINQNTSTQKKQLRWSSGNLGTGTHTITLTHLTGTYVSLDGFDISGPPTATPTRTNTFTPTMTRTPTASLTPRPPVGNGTYDERAVDVVYTGSWVAQAVTGNYLSTEKYSKVIGSTASFTFTGEEVSVIYRGYPVRFGNMGVVIDGTSVATIDQNTTTQKLQLRWASGPLTGENHTIVLTHLTGTYVSLDGFIVSGLPAATATVTNTLTPTMTLTETLTPTSSLTPTETFTPTQSLTPTETFTPTQSLTPTETFTPTQSLTPTETFTPTPSFTPTVTSISSSTNTTTPTQTSIPPVGIGTYDERNTQILYTGTWVAQPVSGNYMNTEKYSKVVGSKARFTFTGEQVSVIYRGYPTVFGNLRVNIDGIDAATINQSTSKQMLQLRWISASLGTGTHTIVVTHQSGTYVSLDGFIVSGSPAVTATVGPTSTASSTPTASPTPTASSTPNGGPTATLVPIYAYNLVHSGNFGSQTLANCHAIGYAHKVTGGTGSLYIRIYVDNVLVGGKFSNTGGSIDFDLTNLPSFTFAPGVEHEVRMMAILENSQPYDLINPVTHQPGGLLTCQ